jgi:pimeloyl-ACP methyl ester carboxylesterase
MGGWIALHLALERPERVAGLVLVAPAVDITARFWGQLGAAKQALLQQGGSISLGSSFITDGSDAVTMRFFEQGERHFLFGSGGGGGGSSGLKGIRCPVVMLHSVLDDVVPVEVSYELLRRLPAGTQLHQVPDGDHRLARPQDLALLRCVASLMLGACAAP